MTARERNRERDARVRGAADAYLSARIALMGATAGNMLDATREVDRTFHDLIVASGRSCADVGCWHEHDSEGDDSADT